MKVLKCFFFLFSLCLCGCDPNKRPTKEVVKVDLPDSSNIQQFMAYKYTQNIVHELNLQNLKSGMDSFELRLFEDFTLGSPDRLFIIKNENNLWSGTLLTYYARKPKKGERKFNESNYRDQYLNSIVDSFQAVKIFPQCGWNQLADSLRNLNLNHIPAQTDIPHFTNIVGDGMQYSFEIATREHYRFFSYHNPETYEDEHNTKVTHLLGLISRQFSFYE